MTLQYAVEHGGIELTQTKAFKRVFVHWAAEHINWPGTGYEELFRYNKVLNEYEFPPLEMTHFLLTQLKLGRHYKGRFKATKKGATLAGQRGKLFGELVPFFLFSIDHASYSRFGEQPVGNWDTWLNVINVEADHGADQKQIFKTFYGYEASFAAGNWREAAVFSFCVLHPLEWAGFFGSHRNQRRRWADRASLRENRPMAICTQAGYGRPTQTRPAAVIWLGYMQI